MSGAWWLVARREITVKVTDRSFQVGTLLSVGLIAGLLVLQAFLAGRTHTVDLAVTPADRAMAQQVAERAPSVDRKVVVHVRDVADDARAAADLRSGAADAWLHRTDAGWTLTTKSEPDTDLEPVVAEVVRDRTLADNAAAAGTSVEALNAGTRLGATLLQGDGDRARLVGALGFAFAFLFYVASLMFGVTLAGSVVEEKQSRIVEIIATAVPVRQLLAGKVVGNTLLAIGQLVLYVAVGLAGLAFTDYRRFVPGISGAVVWFLVFFLAGFVALACLWAVAGSLASRAEDLQSTTAPLSMLMVAVFFSSLLLKGKALVIASFVPPLSAVLMPTRLLSGDAGWWEAVVALALLLVASAATVVAGERLYRRSLLQTGGLIGLRAAWNAEA